MIVIVPSSLPLVAEYYRTYGVDASWAGSLTFGPREVVSPPIGSFEDLLRTVLQHASRTKRFLIVSHGSPEGLVMSIVPGSKYPADDKILGPLAAYATGARHLKDQLLDKWEVDQQMVRPFADAKHLDRFAELLRQVMMSGLEQVHFRACNIGAGRGLGALATAFGSKHTSAPTSWYLYGWRSTATLSAKAEDPRFRDTLDRLPHPRRIYSRDECLLPSEPGRSGSEPALALNARWGKQHKPDLGDVHAVSQAAVEGWTRAFFEDAQFFPFGQRAPGGGYKRGQKLVVFGLANLEDSNNPVLFPGNGMQFLTKLAVVNR